VTRLGILGGTFDPIHAGHLDLARACREAASLDEVLFLANRLPPHKEQALASGYHRHAMVALATSGDAGFVADPRELLREGASYTIETLAALGGERPDADVFFVMGADSLRELPSWRRWRELLERATFVVAGRGGLLAASALAGQSEDFPRHRVMVVAHEPPPVSSTDLRRRLAAGEAPTGDVPDAVLDYILKNRLYGASGRHGQPGPRRRK
jgi:nicotinate-nucleotide adenylyltransferase